MSKYKKAKVLLETKALYKEKKPIYATRKLSIGLVSCMLGLTLFAPHVFAQDEAVDKAQAQEADQEQGQEEAKNEVDKNKEIEKTNEDKTTETSEDQKIKVPKVPKVAEVAHEPSQEEDLLTKAEIQEIRDRTNSLENDYYFNDKMLEELKAELRKAKADPSVNYEDVKARLIDEAIQKNTPTQKAPGEERAVKKPEIDPVFVNATTISGGNLAKTRVNKKLVIATVHVTLKGQDGTVKATLEDTPKSGTKWKVDLPKGVTVAEGDTVTVYQQLGEDKSPEVTANAKASKAGSVTLTMPSGEIWIEQTSSNQVNKDEQDEAVEMLKKANPDIAGDFSSVTFSINGTEHAYYEVTYGDGSTTEKIEAPDLKIKQVTETSAAPTIEKVQVTDGQIIVTLDKEVAKDTKFYFIKEFTDGEDKKFCDNGYCKVDKSTEQNMDQAVSIDGKKVTFSIKDDDLKLERNFGITVKEPHKLRSCAIA